MPCRILNGLYTVSMRDFAPLNDVRVPGGCRQARKHAGPRARTQVGTHTRKLARMHACTHARTHARGYLLAARTQTHELCTHLQGARTLMRAARAGVKDLCGTLARQLSFLSRRRWRSQARNRNSFMPDCSFQPEFPHLLPSSLFCLPVHFNGSVCVSVYLYVSCLSVCFCLSLSLSFSLFLSLSLSFFLFLSATE